MLPVWVGAVRSANSLYPHLQLSYMEITRRLGLGGCYTGVVATWMRDVPFSMVYFSIYSNSVAYMRSRPALEGRGGLAAFLGGAVAGTTAAAISTPLDVIKTRVHSAAEPANMPLLKFIAREKNLVTTQINNILANEGAFRLRGWLLLALAIVMIVTLILVLSTGRGAFFKGLVPRCFIISPLFAITMFCYEGLQNKFG